jgi:ubiquinone/menaquinone biosynthesis C-methylase UbiE
MKLSQTASSSSYWHHDAKQFDEFYRNNTNYFSPELVVNKFLSKRTNTLRTYTAVTSKTILLDLGCGPGEQMKEFIPRCHFVYGVDYSQQMINLAKQVLHGVSEKKYKLITADAGKLPLSTKSVDVVIAMGLLDYVPSPDRVVSECRRVLRPKGVFVFSMPKVPSIFSFFRTPMGIVIRKKLFHLPPIRNAVSSDEVKRLLSHHGFLINNITSVWGAMWMVKAILP